MNKTSNCYAAWCRPDGIIGNKLRYFFRKGIPATLAVGVGVGVNIGLNSFIHTLKDMPQLNNLELSGVIGIFTTSLTYVLLDYGFEQFWHTNYHDNYREHAINDFNCFTPSLDETNLQTQAMQTYQSF